MTKENIKKIIDDHELWLKSSGKQGTRADFTGMNLIGCVFERHDLRYAIFKNAKMSRACFYYCKLKETDFTGADLRASTICFCSVHKADFSNANLFKLKCVCSNFFGSNFHDADMSNAKLYHVDLVEANLECFLHGTEITYGNILHAKFSDRETLCKLEDSKICFSGKNEYSKYFERGKGRQIKR